MVAIVVSSGYTTLNIHVGRYIFRLCTSGLGRVYFVPASSFSASDILCSRCPLLLSIFPEIVNNFR
jgi:hypothetical protein